MNPPEPGPRAVAGPAPTAPGLGGALVAIALVVAVIGSLGAPLITAVATTAGVSLGAAQWTLTLTLLTGAISGPVLARLGSGPARRKTIVVTLALVALGGALTAAPLPFPALLAGRALQGLGLGVVALLMAVARDHLGAQRSTSTIATLSVASTVGIGIGYPLIGLVDQVAGLRSAYGLGFALSLIALAIAWRTLPREAPGPRARVDAVGAALLAAATLAVLLAVAEPALWRPWWLGALVLTISGATLAIWGRGQLRAARPLVRLRLLAQPAALRANAAMALAGVGMYLLFSLLTRYLQTPTGATYGFSLPGVAAGAALIPFSALGFAAGRLAPAAIRRSSPRWVYAGAALSVILAAALFAAAPASLIAVLVAMALLGFGVGGVSALMPALVLAGVPAAESASVLSINQLVRSIAFSIGSAAAGALLTASTTPGALLPTRAGFTTSALWTLPLLALSTVALLAPRRPATA